MQVQIHEWTEVQNMKGERMQIAVNRKQREIHERSLQNYILRNDRTENVQRINRANEYHRERMMQKIKIENERSSKLQAEKREMMEHRKLLKQQIDADKHQVQEDFELMKMGKIAPDVIAKKYNYQWKGPNEMDDEHNAPPEPPVREQPKKPDPIKTVKSPNKKLPPITNTSSSKPKMNARSSQSELQAKKDEAKRQKVEKIKSIQNREMLQVLEEEQK